MTEFPQHVLDLIRMAVEEDLGPGDITTEATIDRDAPGEAVILARQPLVCCGLGLVQAIFDEVGQGVSTGLLAGEGDSIDSGALIAELKGPLRVLMAGERTALNFLQRLCGVATLSRNYADKAAGRAVILDSRKTVPGWRWLDKMAVRTGGCSNHRMGLYDGILIKDNHIAACGGIAEAVLRARQNGPGDCLIEVEVEDLRQLEEAIGCDVDIVMLDNFSPQEVKKAVQFNNGRVRIEVSGRLNLGNMDAYLDAGAFDYLSVGELTHSAPSADIAMEVRWTMSG
jgi:nicotinate-nucleotide pyrophosphorylase (carboxylating)